jgi:hypothetical protein
MEIASEHLLKMTALVMLIRENQAAKPTTEGTVAIAFPYPLSLKLANAKVQLIVSEVRSLR